MTAPKPRYLTLDLSDLSFAFQIPDSPSYGVTIIGRVRRLDTGRWVTPAPAKRGGYLQVSLWENGKGKTRWVHQLVALTFHGPRPAEKRDCAHADGNKHNNYYMNVRWATRAENERDKIAHGRSNRGRKRVQPHASDGAIA